MLLWLGFKFYSYYQIKNKIILKGNKELTNLQSEEQEYETSCIGFQIPNGEEYYDEDDDE